LASLILFQPSFAFRLPALGGFLSAGAGSSPLFLAFVALGLQTFGFSFGEPSVLFELCFGFSCGSG
ncbi:hypothetical protein ISN44_As09g011470, partial [Arabidopsis suecica]